MVAAREMDLVGPEEVVLAAGRVRVGQFRCSIANPVFRDSGPIQNFLVVFPRNAVEITHAGTARAPDGAIVTAGGRVLNVTGLGDGPGAARDAAYAAADLITYEGRQLRRDIALRAVERIG